MRRLGDVLSSLTSKKDVVPYENSVLTQILGDSLGIQFPSCVYGGSCYYHRVVRATKVSFLSNGNNSKFFLLCPTYGALFLFVVFLCIGAIN
jgi:hypothetical protein